MDLPLNNGEYKRREYWDERYKNEEKYDWFTAYSAFKELVVASISPNDKILMLGKYLFEVGLLQYSGMKVFRKFPEIRKF